MPRTTCRYSEINRQKNKFNQHIGNRTSTLSRKANRHACASLRSTAAGWCLPTASLPTWRLWQAWTSRYGVWSPTSSPIPTWLRNVCFNQNNAYLNFFRFCKLAGAMTTLRQLRITQVVIIIVIAEEHQDSIFIVNHCNGVIRSR